MGVNKKVNMKVFAATVIALATAEKKVPPRHPLQRLNKLNKFANEWVSDNLDVKQAANWGPKFDRNTERLERRFELCGFYDETSEHGGPRERRVIQHHPGFSKWAQRYVEECKLQPAKQVDRMNKWFGQLTGKLAQNQASAEEESDDGY